MSQSELIHETVSLGDLVKIKDKYKKQLMRTYKFSKDTIMSFFKVVGKDPGILVVSPIEASGKYRVSVDMLSPAT